MPADLARRDLVVSLALLTAVRAAERNYMIQHAAYPGSVAVLAGPALYNALARDPQGAQVGMWHLDIITGELRASALRAPVLVAVRSGPDPWAYTVVLGASLTASTAAVASDQHAAGPPDGIHTSHLTDTTDTRMGG